jgi:predicted aconitase
VKEKATERPAHDMMKLTAEEQAIFRGDQGHILQKVMRSVVLYGKALGATRLIPIDGLPHLVISLGGRTNAFHHKMINELITAGLRTPLPFTVNPRPLDFENVHCNLLERLFFWYTYRKQGDYEQQLAKIGLKNDTAFTCTCYLPEVGNTPTRNAVLAWSESSAVVFANSVLGARTNRNSAGMDLLCNLLGKVPLFGLLADQGRRATWLIEMPTSSLPNAQVLGSAIGMRVVEDVPYIVGLDRLLGPGLSESTIDYLKDMGAASASSGAVGLCHVEGITPEADEMGRDLLVPDYQTYVIDDEELLRMTKCYPVFWKGHKCPPRLCFIGCPHLSLNQLYKWTEDLVGALNRTRLRVETIFCAAPGVVEKFRADRYAWRKLVNAGARLTSICPLAYMGNPLCARKPVVTNSNKLRTYSTARFFIDEDILDIITTGQMTEEP